MALARILAIAICCLLIAIVAGAPFSGVAGDELTARLGARPLGTRARAAPIAPPRASRIDYARIDARLGALIEDPAMVGLAVAIVEDGRIAYARGFGVTARGSRDPVTADTVFRWASLSKGAAATMVALLDERGRIDLDAPLTRYATSLHLPFGNEARVTVADLLAHRLGIGHNTHDPKLEDGESPAMLRASMAALAPGCPPATCHDYQNVAFDAASELVVSAVDDSYEAALRQWLFEPLGMRSASTTRAGLVRAPSWARPHPGPGAPVEVLEPYYRVPAAGGVNSSILDLAVWMQAQMGMAPEVLSPSVLAALHRPQVRTIGEDRRNRRYLGRLTNAHYALGWRVYDYAGHRLIGHRGAVSGYRSMILFDPESRTGVVAMWNSSSGRPFGVAIDVFDMLYGLPDGDWTRGGEGPAEAMPDAAIAGEIPVSATGRRRPGATFEALSTR